jgi:hypothetical protein
MSCSGLAESAVTEISNSPGPKYVLCTYLATFNHACLNAGFAPNFPMLPTYVPHMGYREKVSGIRDTWMQYTVKSGAGNKSYLRSTE